MTWQELPSILERLSRANLATIAERQLSAAELLCDFESHPTTSMHDESENRKILSFLADCRWPQDAGPHLILEFCQRIAQAQDIVRFVLGEADGIPAGHKARNLHIPDEELLRWLLIDYWHYAGIWKQIFELARRKNIP
jgi:hypothetical protein